MAQQASIRHLSEAERCVVLERVFEYISDILTLKSLTLASKQTRSVVYRSNGLRQLTYKSYCKLNEVNISYEKLKDGLRWIWTIGKRLRTVYLAVYNDSIVLPLLNSLAATEKRPIETIEIRELPCEMAFELVRESRNTLRHLRGEFWDHHQPSAASSCPILNPESQIFWSVVQKCERLDSLDLKFAREFRIFPMELAQALGHITLKHLGLGFSSMGTSKTLAVQKIVEVLSMENLRNNLESLEFEIPINVWLFHFLGEQLASSVPSPVVFVNVTEMTFDFLELCCLPDRMNWLTFWIVFPAVYKIKNKFSHKCYHNTRRFKNVSSFCQMYFQVRASRSCDMKIEIPVESHTSSYTRVSIAVAAKAATLPEDQEWCVSHGVQIETETCDGKVERVTLRKDTSTLVFHFKKYD